MTIVSDLKSYFDDNNNVISYEGEMLSQGIRILFCGLNNKLIIDKRARVKNLSVRFDCDNGVVKIGKHWGLSPLRANIRVGQDSSIFIGENVTATTPVQLSAVEGTSIHIDDDVMIAGNVKIRGDDGHPIFDIDSGKRVNPAQDIRIRGHVWVGMDSTILGGSFLDEGSVVGTKSLVKGKFPNNCIIAGAPAQVIRTDVAWERPHLSLVKPYYKPDASTIEPSPYWHHTNNVQE